MPTVLRFASAARFGRALALTVVTARRSLRPQSRTRRRSSSSSRAPMGTCSRSPRSGTPASRSVVPSRIGPTTGGGVRRPAATGDRVGSPLVVDGNVFASVSDGAGGWFIGGTFTNVGAAAFEPRAHPAGWLALVVEPGRQQHGQALALVGQHALRGRVVRQRRRTVAIERRRPRTPRPASRRRGIPAATVRCAPSRPIRRRSTWAEGSTVDGQSRTRFAAVDAATGRVKSWSAQVSGTSCGTSVDAIVTSGSTVLRRRLHRLPAFGAGNRLAAVDSSTGGLASWNPERERGLVRGMARNGSHVYAAVLHADGRRVACPNRGHRRHDRTREQLVPDRRQHGDVRRGQRQHRSRRRPVPDRRQRACTSMVVAIDATTGAALAGSGAERRAYTVSVLGFERLPRRRICVRRVAPARWSSPRSTHHRSAAAPKSEPRAASSGR